MQFDNSRTPVPPVIRFIAGNLLFGTGLIFHAFLYNFYLDALRLTTVEMGRAAAALTAGGLIMLLPAGPLADRIGLRRTVTLAAVVLAVGLALGAIAASPIAIYGAALVAGAGSVMWRVAVPPILMGLTDEHSRPRAFAWNVGALVGWGGVATALAGWTSTWLGSIRGALLLGAAVSGLSGLCFATLRASPVVTRPSEPAPPRPLSTHLAPLIRDFLPAIALISLFMLGAALAAPFFNLYFQRVHALSVPRIATLFAACNIVWALAVFASGELAGRFGVRRVLAVALLGFAPAMLGLSLVAWLPIAVLLFVLQGAVGPVTNPLIDQWLLGRTAREHQGLISSWRQAAADASAMIGASVGGQVLARGEGGFTGLFLVAAVVGMCGAVALTVVVRRNEG